MASIQIVFLEKNFQKYIPLGQLKKFRANFDWSVLLRQIPEPIGFASPSLCSTQHLLNSSSLPAQCWARS